MNKALVRRRIYLDSLSCIDRWDEIYYKTKQLIGNLWYLYSQSGYVIASFAKEEIKFND